MKYENSARLFYGKLDAKTMRLFSWLDLGWILIINFSSWRSVTKQLNNIKSLGENKGRIDLGKSVYPT